MFNHLDLMSLELLFLACVTDDFLLTLGEY